MPLWQIYHPHGTLEDDASRQAFAQDITTMYTEMGLPAFYVVVHFFQMNDKDVFVGGKFRKLDQTPFIRIVINHIAIHVPDVDALYHRATSRIDQVVRPHVTDKGYDFEYHIDETERRLWKINGMIPPPFKRETEQLWAKENRAIAYDGAYPPTLEVNLSSD
ncbi:hypothetical protein N7488_000683 [Penicillium malachiteum]|nr:hypothetical protein N7488_000683 [Penicillium malachiteum]